jgi:hypothetical protein
MLDRYSVEKIAEGRGAEAIEEAVRDRIALQARTLAAPVARPLSRTAWAGSIRIVPRRTAARLIAAGLRVLTFLS